MTPIPRFRLWAAKRKLLRARVPIAVAVASAAALPGIAIAAATFAPLGNRPTVPPADEGEASATIAEENPFHFAGPGVEPQNLAGPPGIGNAPAETDPAKIRQNLPAMRLLAASDRSQFTLASASGRGDATVFSWETYYVDDVQRRVVVVSSWTKFGRFNLVVTPNSPVRDIRLTTLDGLPALTLLPSKNVVGGLGPRTAFIYRDGVIYRVDGEGFLSDDSFLSIVHNFLGELAR